MKAILSQVIVPRGSLLALAERSADITRTVTVNVKVLDMPGVKANVRTKQMREIHSQQGELLAAVRGPEDRYMLLDSQRLNNIQMGDKVVYCAPREIPVPAVVKFLGAVPELRSRGYLLGLEITLEDWGLGETDGSVIEGRQYFSTDQSRGIFCDVSRIRIEKTVGDAQQPSHRVLGPAQQQVGLIEKLELWLWNQFSGFKESAWTRSTTSTSTPGSRRS